MEQNGAPGCEARTKTLLLTAFEPFGGEARNAALDAVSRVPETLGGLRIVKLTAPTVFGGSVDAVTEAVKRLRPDAVLMVGQAGARSVLTPERSAVNRMDARIPDNAGNQPTGRPIMPDGPAFYESTLPVDAMLRAIRAAGVPAEASCDAGRFVCNQLFYGVRHYLEENKLPIPAGFLHVPRSEEQAEAGRPCLPLSKIVDGLIAAILAIAKNSCTADKAVL